MFDFLSKKFYSIFSGISGKTLTKDIVDKTLQEVSDALLEADVPHKLIEEFCADIKKESLGKKVSSSLKPGDQLIKIVHERLNKFLGGKNEVAFSFQIPSITLVMGLQGSGKTTTLAKLAFWIQRQAEKRKKKRSILLASVDFYRPAALDQLEQLAKQVGVNFYRAPSKNPGQAAKEIVQHFKQNQYDLLLLDTAGRMHIDNNMLQELREIEATIKPHYKFLILDAMTGQESLEVACAFDQGVGFDHAILTKMDSQTRGGAAFSFRYALKKPLLFVGIGEKYPDFEIFHPDRMANRILGMGDIISLIEKADEKISKDAQKSSYKAFMSGKYTLQDFADQMSMMSKLGSFSSILKFLPGVGGLNLTPEKIQKSEYQMKVFKAIISSMTPKERLEPGILSPSRKQRIAKGAGVEVSEINLLISRFQESKQYAKLFKKFGRSNSLFK